MRDLRVDESGALQLQEGDFKLGKSTKQHQRHLLVSEKGAHKEVLELGVGLHSMLNDDSQQEILLEVRRQFERDGMKVEELRWHSDGSL